jgi:hypothetical protein
VACDGGDPDEQRELTRLRVLIDLSDKRLTIEAAGT